MDEKLLSALDLSTQEIKLYRVVVNEREISPALLSKKAGVKRTTAYSMARGLVEKGLLIEDATRRPRVFLPARSEDIAGVIKIEKKRSEEKQALLLQLADEVGKAEAEINYPVPKIRFIEEDKIRAFLSQRTPEWIESMDKVDKVFWGFQDPTLLDSYLDWIDTFWKRAPKDFEVKLLTNLSTTEKGVAGRYERRQTKFWGEAVDFRSSTWIIGDYVIILNTRKHPFYVVEIHDELMAHDQREIFKNLWEMV